MAAGEGVASRRLALEVLIQIEKEKAYANIALSNAFKRKTLSERDRAFVTALVQGVIRRLSELDAKLKPLSTKPLEKLPIALRNVLRLAIFQLDYMKDIPASAVLDISNKLARATGHEGSAKYANGVLRAYLRTAETKDSGTAETKSADVGSAGVPPASISGDESATTSDTATSPEQLAVRFSLPPWLVTKWLNTWGLEETLRLLEHSQQIPELSVRTCETCITPEGLLQILQSKGIVCTPGELVDTCIIVRDRGPFKGPIDKLPGYSEGLFTVQDEAAAFVSRVVDPKPGEVVIDLCAAPGGKALHMAEMMENKGRVLAVDIHTSRLNLLRKSRQRIGLTNVETYAADAREFQPDTKADRILIDAPCTGTGVISRRSDIRLHRQAPDIDQLVTLQRQMLSHATTLLKPGGVLVYSTCSIEPEENINNFRWFLLAYPNFSPESIRPLIPQPLLQRWEQSDPDIEKSLEEGWLQILPSRHSLSGFFICRLKRNEEV